MTLPTPPNPTPPSDFWDERYRSTDYFYGTEPHSWLTLQAPKLWSQGDRLLVVADGEGRNGVWLAEQGFRVESFDASPVAVAKARALAEARGVTLVQDVASADEFHGSEEGYDGVVGVFIQFAGPDLRARLFGSMIRALRPGGILLLVGYTPAQLALGTGGPSNPEQLYTEALLQTAFADLEIELLETVEESIEEGVGHRGPSALIRLIARKPSSRPT
jgi:SAM-dependent methyltransferase